jgi:hypothetical protein
MQVDWECPSLGKPPGQPLQAVCADILRFYTDKEVQASLLGCLTRPQEHWGPGPDDTKPSGPPPTVVRCEPMPEPDPECSEMLSGADALD